MKNRIDPEAEQLLPQHDNPIGAPDRIESWRRLLRRDRAGLRRPEIPIEAFYDKETGLLR